MPDDIESVSLTQKLGNMVITAIVGGGIGFLGSYFTLQQRVADNDRRVSALEASTVSREQTKSLLDAINAANVSIDKRLSTIEGVLMHGK
jgi:hypothetical protein